MTSDQGWDKGWTGDHQKNQDQVSLWDWYIHHHWMVYFLWYLNAGINIPTSHGILWVLGYHLVQFRNLKCLAFSPPKTLFHIALRRPVAYLFATPPRVGSSPALGYDVNSLDGGFSEYSNMPLEHTKTTPQPTIYEGIPFIWEFSGYAPLGMLGFFLEEGLSCGVWVVLFFLRKLSELQESFY